MLSKCRMIRLDQLNYIGEAFGLEFKPNSQKTPKSAHVCVEGKPQEVKNKEKKKNHAELNWQSPIFSPYLVKRKVKSKSPMGLLSPLAKKKKKTHVCT